MTYKDVTAARNQAHEACMHLVTVIPANYGLPEQAATRSQLLTPYLTQNAAVKEAFRSRRPIDDIDPSDPNVIVPAPRRSFPRARPLPADERLIPSGLLHP